jgi:pimeloyl-ACP methyl ester carboxylesterase
MTLAHDVHGDGTPLLLVHGMTLDRRMWEPNMAALTQHHRVVRCELRGFGATPPPDGPFSHADDLRALLGELGIDRAAVAGLSMGGAVALELALAHPEAVSALVLVDSDLPGVPLDDELAAALHVVRLHARAGDLEAARAAWLAMPFFAPSPPHVAAALAEMVADYSFWHLRNPRLQVGLEPPACDRLGAVVAPTLVVRGEHDVPLVAAHAERLAREIPRARALVLEGAGHMSNMDAPEAFDAALLAFLAECGAEA